VSRTVTAGSSANTEQIGASKSGKLAVGTVAVAPPLRWAAAPTGAASADTADGVHRPLLRLMRTNGAAIVRMLWRILGREQDVLDAYQDCFCKLAARAGRFDPANARAYVFRTATNIAIEMIRMRRRHEAHRPAVAAHRGQHDTVENSEADDAPADRSGDLRQAIARLPAHLRNVIVLRDLSRLAYDEVARVLGIEPTTARVYRRHAVVKLAEMLDAGEES